MQMMTMKSLSNELINDDDETTIDGPTTAAPSAPRGPKSHAEMTAVERERADAMDVRCLDLCIGMLECVNAYPYDIVVVYE
jgi:condensin complex subunit 3